MNDKLRLLQNMRIGYNFIGKLPFILGIFLALIGKKRYFLALGTIPVNGVGFIGRKITAFERKPTCFL